MARKTKIISKIKKECEQNSTEVLEILVNLMEEKQADNITKISLEGKSSIGDYMLIVSGGSQRQVTSLAGFVIRTLKSIGLGGIRAEGADQGDWILIDAGDVIVHIFRPEVREFYNLEKMWKPRLENFDEKMDPLA